MAIPLAFLVVGALLFAGLFVVLGRPGKFHYERSIEIAAPPSRVFEHVSSFRAWQAWSPWEGLDPNMKRSYQGSGLGESYGWESDHKKVGAGRMTVTALEPPERLALRLEFLRPFAATNSALFTFHSSGPSTRVTWSMDGENGFAAKAASVVINMDKLVGSDFERGLARLKAVVEAEAPATPGLQPSSSSST